MHVQLGEEKEELMTDGFFQVPCSSQRTSCVVGRKKATGLNCSQ